MEKRPRILVLTVNAWNSLIGDNTWATLLSPYESENIANIYIREETPDSQICSRYFCISENKVIKSILKRKMKTGREVTARPLSEAENSDDLRVHNERYAKMKKKRRYSMLLARELCWKFGRWKTKELNAFLDNFKPDIILFSMEGYIHLNRIVQYAQKRTGAKAIGYIWDDNFTYKQSKKLGYKVYRFFQRKSLKKLAKQTYHFFAITPKTKEEADRFFHIDCTLLSKPLNKTSTAENYEKMNKPLKMLYTGNLLIGREQTLAKISAALKEINKNTKEITLDVYTQTALPEEYLQDTQHDFCRIHAPIPQAEVLQKQKKADVLLFLEDLSDKNLMARLSFSTKITDYFSAGKCIFAVGNHDLAPIQYFQDTDSAVVVTNGEKIMDGLQGLLNQEKLVFYAKNAVDCGLKNHSAEHIHQTFDAVINRVYRGE